MSTYLPPEVLDQIYTEAVQSFKTSVEKDKNYSSFSLVCKNWSGVASRKLLESLKIRNGTHMKLVLKEIGRTGLGHLVKKLEVVFYSSKFDEHEYHNDTSIDEPFTIAQIKEEDMVEMDDFIKLARLLPNVTRLKLSPTSFIRFRRRDLNSISLFPNLTYLNCNLSAKHNELEVLTGLLSSKSQLKYLVLGGNSAWRNLVKPLDQPLTSLKSLISRDRWSDAYLFGRYYNQLYLPLASYVGIETLELVQFSSKFCPNYRQILDVTGSTLRSLTITLISYPDILPLLPLLPSLSVLSVGLDPRTVEDNFLSLLPPSLHTLKRLPISTFVLRHYYNNQRIDFQLEEIVIDFISDELIKLLPSTISRISVSKEIFASRLLSRLIVLNQSSTFSHGVKTVYFDPDPVQAYESAQKKYQQKYGKIFPANLVQGFKNLGISFEEPFDDAEYGWRLKVSD